MSLPDPPPASHRQPSLIDVPNDESARARKAPTMRMLDGLDEDGGKPTSKKANGRAGSGSASTQAMSGFAPTRAEEPTAARAGRTGWIVATAIALLVLAVLWWWTQLRDASSTSRDAAVGALATPAVASPSPASSASKMAAAPGDAGADASTAASSAGLATAATSTASIEPARIETVREADTPVSPPLASGRSQSGGAPFGQRANTLATASPAVGAAASAPPTGSAVASARPTTVNAPPTASRASVPSSMLPAAAPPVATTAATVAKTTPARKPDAAKPTSGDPDVALFDALLSRIGGGAKPDPNALPLPALGDLIERCEARAGKDTPEAATCRPRICADQWGKAAACPAALAPPKD